MLQAAGLWLPTSPFDYAVVDLAVVDADFQGARVTLSVDSVLGPEK